jgi:hypothetical protein
MGLGCFEPEVVLNFKATAAETGIYHGLKLHFCNLRTIGFLTMPYSCIKRQFVKIYKAGYSRCIIEKEVKVNIMRFRTLRSIEFKGLCSRNWNLSRSENCIFGISDRSTGPWCQASHILGDFQGMARGWW